MAVDVRSWDNAFRVRLPAASSFDEFVALVRFSFEVEEIALRYYTGARYTRHTLDQANYKQNIGRISVCGFVVWVATEGDGAEDSDGRWTPLGQP